MSSLWSEFPDDLRLQVTGSHTTHRWERIRASSISPPVPVQVAVPNAAEDSVNAGLIFCSQDPGVVGRRSPSSSHRRRCASWNNERAAQLCQNPTSPTRIVPRARRETRSGKYLKIPANSANEEQLHALLSDEFAAAGSDHTIRCSVPLFHRNAEFATSSASSPCRRNWLAKPQHSSQSPPRTGLLTRERNSHR